MQFKKFVLATVAIPGLLMTSCIDDKYDLSDIDTNVRVDVNNLTVPVNIDEITLKSVFDIEEGDRIQVVNGEYAVIEDGTFTSDGLKVDAFVIPAPSIPSSETSLSTGMGGIPVSSLPVSVIELPFSTAPSQFSTDAYEISPSVVAIESVKVDCNMTISISIAELAGKVKSLSVRGLKMYLPAGLELTSAQGSYDPETGMFTSDEIVSTGNKLAIVMSVTGIDYDKSNLKYEYGEDSRKLSINDKMSIQSATLVMKASDFVQGATVPADLTIKTEYNMGQISVNSFTGKMKYSIEGTEITDINLDDIPDVLAQAGTDVKLNNPQIYLSVNNPLENYGMKATTGLTITSYRDGDRSNEFSLDAPGYFTVPGLPGHGVYNFYMSPKAVQQTLEGYDGAQHVGFSALQNVLSGDGLPKRLGIVLDNPSLPEQHVENFLLGHDYGSVEGHYTFYAPVELGDGSVIFYSDKIDGWSDDDLDNVTINTLIVKATVSTDIPISVDFTGYPVDAEGKQIGNVTITGAKINPNADKQQLEIRVDGVVRGLDGIYFEAVARSADGAGALRPGMTINVSDIRATVNGYFEKEL